LIKVAYWCPNNPLHGAALIPSSCTIQQLKQHLEPRTQIPAINQRLFASRELDGSIDTATGESSTNLQSLLVPHTTNQQQHPIIHLMVVSNQDSPPSSAASSGHNHQEILEAHAIISNLVDQLQGSRPSFFLWH